MSRAEVWTALTVAVVVKVYDGIALAADSATTMHLAGGAAQVWNNANKVFHLHRAYPIGAVTWGAGSIGGASIETLAKDFRHELMNGTRKLINDYRVADVAAHFAQWLQDFRKSDDADAEAEGPGLLVCGYDGGSRVAECWQIQINRSGSEPDLKLIIGPEEFGWSSFGQTAATHRLFWGWDTSLPEILKVRLSDAEWLKVRDIFTDAGDLTRLPVAPPMPFVDAVQLATFMVDTTVGYSRYRMGPDTVGGPIEVAGITRHEGFKWVRRKHYYASELNPKEPGHAD